MDPCQVYLTLYLECEGCQVCLTSGFLGRQCRLRSRADSSRLKSDQPLGLTALAYTMATGFMSPYGAVYLPSLGLAFGIAIRVRGTIEASS
jgi:hypothetical protein